jgi:hypothetical protein
MLAVNKIKQALKLIWDEGEVNACHIYKVTGSTKMHSDYGWYVKPFGEQAQWLGNTVNDVLEEVERRYLEQEKIKSELVADGVWQFIVDLG